MAHITALNDQCTDPASRLPQQPVAVQSVFDAVKEFALLTLDLCGNIISWNRGAECIYGWKPDEVLGRHIGLLYSSEALIVVIVFSFFL